MHDKEQIIIPNKKLQQLTIAVGNPAGCQK